MNTAEPSEGAARSPVPPALVRVLRRLEDGALVVALAFATLLPLVDALGRPLGGFHVPGSGLYVQQLTLWLAFVGGLLATRERQHLTLSTAELLGEGRLRRVSRLVAFSVAGAVLACWPMPAWS